MPPVLFVMLEMSSVKKATSNNSLKAMRRKLVLLLSLILGGGDLLGRLPWACCSMVVSCADGLEMVGNPLDKGKENGAAETNSKYDTPTSEAEATAKNIID